jgi:Predicted ATPase or kinase
VVQYFTINKKVNIAHYDLYRIGKVKDLINIGLYDQEDIFLNIIEWPELIKKKIKIE